MTDWYGWNNRVNLNVTIDSDAGADQVFPLFRAPVACELRDAWMLMTDAVAASGANHIACHLMNGGTAGTATTSISGTIGGTGGWTALLPVDFSVATNALAAGEMVVLNYNETGTVAPGVPMVVTLHVQMMKGEETIEAEISTAQDAIDTLKDSIDAVLVDSTFFPGDTVQFARALSDDLDKMSRRLIDYQTQCASRWKDRL